MEIHHESMFNVKMIKYHKANSSNDLITQL